MWSYDEYEDEPTFGDVMRVAYMQGLLQERLVSLALGGQVHISDVDDEPEENQAQQIEEARRLKQAGLPYLNAPTIEPEFGRFFNDPSYSDLTLKVGSRSFHAHRLILSSWSSVFQDILTKGDLATRAPAEDGGLPTYRLKEDPDSCAVFDTFLKFLYTEEITFSEDTIMPLLKLSNKYKIDELNKLCDSYVGDLKLDVSSAISVLIQAMKYQMGHTVESCISVLRSNFELMSAEQVQVLDSSLIIALLDCKEQSLVVKDEFSLFEKLTPWLANCTDNEIFKTVIGCIRFPFMSAAQLKAIGSSDMMRRIEEVTSPAFLAEALEQHSLYREAFAVEFNKPVPLPRLYLKPQGAMFGQTEDAPTKEKCDEEGFMPIELKSMESTQSSLQNVLLNGTEERARSRYAFDHLRWMIDVKQHQTMQTVKKQDIGQVPLFGLKISLLRKCMRDLQYYMHGASSAKAETQFDDQVVEVAVQVKYEDGSSHVLASRRSLKHEDQKDDMELFTFETPCLLQSVPDRVLIRASVVIHQSPESQSKNK